MSWQNAIFLNDSEQIIEAWSGDWEQFFKTVVSKDGFLGTNYVPVEAKGRSKGVLVLTNSRLVWLEKRGVEGVEKGLVNLSDNIVEFILVLRSSFNPKLEEESCKPLTD